MATFQSPDKKYHAWQVSRKIGDKVFVCCTRRAECRDNGYYKIVKLDGTILTLKNEKGKEIRRAAEFIFPTCHLEQSFKTAWMKELERERTRFYKNEKETVDST